MRMWMGGWLLAAAVTELATSADAFIVSDYAKGAVAEAIVAAVVAAARPRGVRIVADPKHRDLARYRGVTVITPNPGELELAAGRRLVTDADFSSAAIRRSCTATRPTSARSRCTKSSASAPARA